MKNFLFGGFFSYFGQSNLTHGRRQFDFLHCVRRLSCLKPTSTRVSVYT